MKYLVLNFTHPLSDKNMSELEALLLNVDVSIKDIKVDIVQSESLLPQARSVVSTALDGVDNKTVILVNPPGMANMALVVENLLRREVGYHPGVVRIVPVKGPVPTYKVSEILYLEN